MPHAGFGVLLRGPLPSCPDCGSVARPSILMFGDGDWEPGRAAVQLADHRAFLRAARADGLRIAVVEIGAGTAVSTVRREAELAAATSGALVRINPREPHVRDPRGVGIAAPAAETLLALDAVLRGGA